jgi:hypothetical protein
LTFSKEQFDRKGRNERKEKSAGGFRMKISGPSAFAFLAPLAVNFPVNPNKTLDLKSHA